MTSWRSRGRPEWLAWARGAHEDAHEKSRVPGQNTPIDHGDACVRFPLGGGEDRWRARNDVDGVRQRPGGTLIHGATDDDEMIRIMTGLLPHKIEE